MKIFVTGASGFLGRFLSQALVSEGHEVVAPTSKECNLLKEDSLKAFNTLRFDQIFHLAAWTQAGDFCLRHPGEQWIHNQAINTNVLTWWHRQQPQAKMICMGTSCSYDSHLPLIEENYLEGKPIESLFTYAMTKRMLLTGLIALNKQFGLEYLYIVPSTLYGPYYHTDGRQLHFIFDLIRKICRGKLHGEPVALWGDGEQKRELVHIADFVKALLLLNQKEKNNLFNIGAGKEHSIKEFAKLICEKVDFPFEKIQYDLSKYVGARSKVLDIGRFSKSLPHFRFIDLKLGLEETVDWFLEHNQTLLSSAAIS